MLIPIGNDTVRYRTPWVTYGVIAVNVLVYARMFFLSEFDFAMTVMKYGSLGESWRPWRSVTGGFLHADLLHLLGNMWFLFLFGCSVEGKLGHVQMAAAYLAGLLISDLAQYVFSPSEYEVCIGASGAVGAYWFLFSRAEVQFFYWLFTFWMGSFWLSVHWSVVYLFGWDVLMWFLDKQYGISDGVANSAHLGGLACGFLVGILLRQFSYVTLDGDDMLTRFNVWRLRRRRFAQPAAEEIPQNGPGVFYNPNGPQAPPASPQHQRPEEKSDGPIVLPLD